MWHYFQLGGLFMWPLALCSVALLGVLIERGVSLVRARGRLCARERQLHRSFVQFFVEVAPALGLLGTMQGIMECFQVAGGNGTPKGALAGLGIACITTIYGLIIALLATIAGFILDSTCQREEVPA